jgi:pyridoxamine 5'-phosphate oxidase
MSNLDNLFNTHPQYGNLDLLEENMHASPIQQFQLWLEQHAKNDELTPTSMVFSTVDASGWPDSRVVLLKGLYKDAFVFYTNYYSAKGQQLSLNPHAALNFYWPETMRQVRVRGLVEKVSEEESDKYFYSRPLESQFSAIASLQSSEISREKLFENYNDVVKNYESSKNVLRPKCWGGYAVTPKEIEFWQGRVNRLHDRILYYYKNDAWSIRRLAP